MTKEDKQIIERATKENWRTGDRTRLKRLLEKNLTLYRENEELEKKLEQTEKDLADYQFNYPKIKELEKENNKLLDVINNQDVKIADLEKENAELKEKIENLQKYLDTQNSYRECAETWLKLTKAKEIIKNLLILKYDHFGNTKMEWRVEVTEQAEQFLKEI